MVEPIPFPPFHQRALANNSKGGASSASSSDTVVLCSYHSLVASCYGTAKGTLVLVFNPASVSGYTSAAHLDIGSKKPHEELAVSSFPIERVQIVERWNVVLLLSGSRVLCVSLKTLKRENPDPGGSHDFAALSFAVDESGDRLAIGAKHRVSILKRVFGGTLQSPRFEPLHTLEVDVPAQDLCFALENGQRWLCISSWDGTIWRSAEQQTRSTGAKARPSLPGADFLVAGRRSDEVLICRTSACTFTTPFQERSTIHFSSAVSQVVLLSPYILGYYKDFNKLELRLDDDQLVQIVDVSLQPASSAVLRWTIMPFIDGETMHRGIACCSGSDPRRRFAFRVSTPLRNQVTALLKSGKLASAYSLTRGLLRIESQWEEPLIEEAEGEEEQEHKVLVELYDRVRFEYAMGLLLTRPVTSTDDLTKAAALLAAFPTQSVFESAEDSTKLAKFLIAFADTDLFDSLDEAHLAIQSLLPLASVARDSAFARFKPGALSVAMRIVVIPLLFRLRQAQIVSITPRDTTAKLIDSILLRAFVLGRPGRNVAPDEKYEAEKRQFLADNRCDIVESERLLLSFPEMWEDHAALLAGKGEFEKGLEWLRVLGMNAPASDVERYALASVRMLRNERPAEMALKYAKWILERCPRVAIDALVAFNCFNGDINEARKYLAEFSDHYLLMKMYLERLVQQDEGEEGGAASERKPGRSSPEAIAELAAIYLNELNQEGFYRLARFVKRRSVISSVAGDFELLLPRLDDWPREQAVVLDLAGRRKEAAFILATKCSVDMAEEYARTTKEVENVFDLVLDGLLSSRPTAGDALSFLVRNFDSVDAAKALSSLPDTLDVSSCMDLVRVALGDRDAGHRDNLVVKQLLRRENLLAREKTGTRDVAIYCGGPGWSLMRGVPAYLQA